MKKAKISLVKHPQENRYLMCWYKFTDGKNVYQFRSENVVTEKEEEKLHKFHCLPISNKELLEKCLTILNPYLEQIKKHIESEIAKPGTPGFSFPGPSVLKIK